MSYDYGLTASGFSADPDAYDDLISEEEETRFDNELKLSKLKNLTYLTKSTGNAKTAEDFANSCIRLAGSKLQNQAIARYCYAENLPHSLVNSSWDKTNLFLILKQYLTALNINLLPENNVNLQSLLSSLLDNSMEETVYQRVGYIQSFVNNIYESNTPLDKELMRQLLSISRLFINVIELKSISLKQRWHQHHLTLKLIEIEKISEMTSFRGKRYIKNWKVRHLRDITYYADEKGREGYQRLLELDVSMSLSEIRDEANEIFYYHLRLV